MASLGTIHPLCSALLVGAAIACSAVCAPLAAAEKEPAYDIVVYGGTSAGVAAAVQASRMGKKVVLIEPTKHLGGLTSGGLGATDIGNKAAIGGIAREFYQRVKKHYDAESAWKWQKAADYRNVGHVSNVPANA